MLNFGKSKRRDMIDSVICLSILFISAVNIFSHIFLINLRQWMYVAWFFSPVIVHLGYGKDMEYATPSPHQFCNRGHGFSPTLWKGPPQIQRIFSTRLPQKTISSPRGVNQSGRDVNVGHVSHILENYQLHDKK